MNKKLAWAVKILIVLGMLAVSWSFYASLPDQIPMHWNAAGQIDSYAPKGFGVWFVPLLGLVFLILFPVIARLDPKHEKYKLFEKSWEMFQITLLAFFLYIHIVTLYLALHPTQSIIPFMLIGLGVLFVLIGNYLGKIRQNYFVGIRTPWTLDNEEVWNKTQRVGGWCFVISGLLFLIDAYFLWQPVVVFIFSIILAAVVPIVYSYVVFKQQIRK